jgi:curli biogenesis system outer membrane secretion channel CsgG
MLGFLTGYTTGGVIHALLVIAALTACGSTPKQTTPGKYADDSIIATNVKYLLAKGDFLL